LRLNPVTNHLSCSLYTVLFLIATVQNNQQVEISQLIEEVVVIAEQIWRIRPSAEAEWRRKLKEYELKDGGFNIEYGYDLAYEEMRTKQSFVFEELGNSGIKPVSLIRIDF